MSSHFLLYFFLPPFSLIFLLLTKQSVTTLFLPPFLPQFPFYIIPISESTKSVKDKMPSAQDPFYVVKEDIQDSIDRLQSNFHQWENTFDTGEHLNLSKEVLAACGSIEWQVDELDKAISVASRDPSWYGIDEKEIENRRRWTSNARTQVRTVKKTVEARKGSNTTTQANMNGMHRELMRHPDSHQSTSNSNQYAAGNNDDFIESESDRQMLLIKRQDEELDELSLSVQRIGGVGLTIHEELLGQEKILDELGNEMDSTSHRLDFVQKRVAMVMKKASVKGQMMMLCALLALFIFLFILVFFT